MGAVDAVGVSLGEVVDSRFRVLSVIGRGGYGHVYKAEDLDGGGEVALKVETPRRRPKPTLRMETLVLRLLGGEAAPRLVGSGRVPRPFIAMELLSQDVSSFRKRTSSGRVSGAWAMRAGREMLAAVEAVHSVGFIHRDIKPSNFAFSLPDHHVKILDFGLSRQFGTAAGGQRRERLDVGFRGTRTYASVGALLRRDQSRRDDLVGLFYVLVELLRGSLPWRKADKSTDARLLKHLYPSLTKGLADEALPSFWAHVDGLSFAQAPDYALLARLLAHPDGLQPCPDPTQLC